MREAQATTAGVEGGRSGVLAEVQRGYDAGRYLDAHQHAAQLGPYESWQATHERLLAGRLLFQLGDARLGLVHHFFAYRRDPGDADALYFHAGTCKSRVPHALLRFLRTHGEPAHASAETRAHLLGLQARALGRLRDFEAAMAALRRAEALARDDAWLLVEQAGVLSDQDRRVAALEAVARALALRPHYRPAVQMHAHLLAELGRLDEAIEALGRSVTALQAGHLHSQRAHLQSEAGAHGDAYASLQAALAQLPCLGDDERRMFEGQLADTAYLGGDLERAAAHARAAGSSFYERMAERLQSRLRGKPNARESSEGQPSASERDRVVVPVPFVRQHHMTCAPATLAAIAQHFEQAVDHAQLAQEICYGGTSDHGERAWAERNGFVTRELRVTLASAKALLDRGVPFTLTTLEPGSGHLQAVFGYDEIRGTLLVRDPSLRHFAEYDAAWLEHYRSSGPRGLTLLPRALGDRLDGLELPDAALYDRLHALERALAAHDRAAAHGELQALRAQAPDDPLTHDGASRLARYDRDPGERLRALTALHAAFPDDARLALGRAYAMFDVEPQERIVAFLQEWAHGRPPVPLLQQLSAELLRRDPREHLQVRTLLLSSLRTSPCDAYGHHVLADALWGVRRYEDAERFYRWASCLAETDEHYAIEYFRAARALRHTDEALAFLEQRVARLGSRAGEPAQTLFTACEEMDRPELGLARLDDALAARPDDGALCLFAAQAHARYGRLEEARALLQRARGRAREVDCLAATARIAGDAGDTGSALSLWQDVARLEPLHPEAQVEVARLLAQAQGAPAAVAHLSAVYAQYPHHLGLAQLLVRWQAELPNGEVEATLRTLVAARPNDPAPHRQLAEHLERAGQPERALLELQACEQLSDRTPPTRTLRGVLLLQRGDHAGAAEAFREALAFSVDHVPAIHGLLTACRTHGERQATLRHVRDELVRQVTDGSGLLAYRERAGGVLESAEILGTLHEANAERPDLPASWDAITLEYVDRGELELAERAALRAVERFPYRESLWLTLARVHELCEAPEAQHEALTRAAQLAPHSTDALRRMVILELDRGDAPAALATAERALRRDRLESRNHGHHALALHRSGRKEEALTALERAVELEPGYDWAWHELDRWGKELGRSDRALELAQALVRTRGGEARSFMVLADRLLERGLLPACLEALEGAIERNPRLEEAHDQRATVLCRLGRHVEAFAACAPAVYGEHLPHPLRGRRAWVDAQRGRTRDAVEAMEQVVAEFPDYYWGFVQLSDWYEKLGDLDGRLRACSGMVRLAPHDARAHGYLADVLREKGDTREAKIQFRRSAELDPDYFFAAGWLFDLCMQERDLDGAEQALRWLGRSGRGELVLAREVELAAVRGAHARACDAFAELCKRTPEGTWAQRHAAEALERAGRIEDVERVLIAVLEGPEIQPGAGFLWTERRKADATSPAQVLAELAPRALGPAGVEAVARWLEQCSDAEPKSELLLKAVAKHGGWLARHTETWGAVGYVLVRAERSRAARRWLADYRGREDAAQWMLSNLAFLLRQAGKDGDAFDVHRHALTRTPDHTVTTHRLWVALDEACRGRRSEALALLDACELDGLDPIRLTVAGLTHVAVRALRKRHRPEYRALRVVRERLLHVDEAGRALYFQEPPLARARGRVVRAIARSRRGWQRWWIGAAW